MERFGGKSGSASATADGPEGDTKTPRRRLPLKSRQWVQEEMDGPRRQSASGVNKVHGRMLRTKEDNIPGKDGLEFRRPGQPRGH